MVRIGMCVIMAVGLVVSARSQSLPPSDGFDFVTIGAAGNRPTIPSEVPIEPTWKIGAVDYEYRITRTEVTTEQWYDFVVAYAPHYSGALNDPLFTSPWIFYQNGQFVIAPGMERVAAGTTWRFAARYMNWLHNGRVSEAWAFESGVYDTSTFTKNPDGTYNDQAAHAPGAMYWIPTQDEWIKAMHYDPDRYGPGQEGYWRMPDGGDEVLISGWPWEGGETDGGIEPGVSPDLPVGSYPWSVSPWGLLDGSGGEWEWVEDWAGGYPEARYRLGSNRWSIAYDWDDRIDTYRSGTPDHGLIGFRVASPIPSPQVWVIMAIGFVMVSWKKRSITCAD